MLPAGLADPTMRRPLTDVFDREEPVVLAATGGPGTGETTLLRHLAAQAAAAGRQQRRRIPVLLVLRDHAAAIVADPNLSLPALLRAVEPALLVRATDERPACRRALLVHGDRIRAGRSPGRRRAATGGGPGRHHVRAALS